MKELWYSFDWKIGHMGYFPLPRDFSLIYKTDHIRQYLVWSWYEWQ